MDIFLRHQIDYTNNEEGTIILYLDPFKVEFANELGSIEKDEVKSLEEKVKEYIKTNVKGIKAKSIKIVVGSIVLMQLSFIPKPLNQTEAAEYNMSYVFFGSTAEQIQYVDRTKGSLDTISPSYFDIHADGSLQISNQFSKTFINEMKNRGVSITPFLSNHWDREVGRAALANRDLLTTQIANVIKEYDLDGVNVDIENVTEVDREAYTDLVRLLREKLPKDKKVSVAVAANPNGWTKGWHGSYDYKQLAKYSDYLMIMAYDESYYGGPSGPVASIGWVERSVLYALNQGVPKDKIVLGMPFFGRYWNDRESIGGQGLSRREAEVLVNDYNGKVYFDESTKSVKATFTIKESDPKPRISGRNLPAGKYTVWYEDERSIQAKIDLVHKYQLKGTGSWALGQENPEMWNSYQIWLEGTPFVDINNHWAKGDILQAYQKGWMVGIEQNKFGPDQALTRAQAAVILARVLELRPINNQTVKPFTDVKSTHWARREIELVNQHGLMVGIEEGKFGPDTALTREQFSVILDRALQKLNAVKVTGTNAKKFSDVSPSRWSAQSIARMNELGVVHGMT